MQLYRLTGDAYALDAEAAPGTALIFPDPINVAVDPGTLVPTGNNLSRSPPMPGQGGGALGAFAASASCRAQLLREGEDQASRSPS